MDTTFRTKDNITNMGRSKPQDQLQAKLEELYPYTNITDEVFIGELIREQGYTIDEIKCELGHKPHKMFVDIIMRDVDRTIAFEYHGEQHFALVGNMTKTTADLLSNKALDEEKSWVLERIGIPLVTIPYDMYIDAEVIEQIIAESSSRVIENNSELTECLECGRLFPTAIMTNGTCKSCSDRTEQIAEQARDAERKARKKQQNEWQKELRKARASAARKYVKQQKQNSVSELSSEQRAERRKRLDEEKRHRRKQREQLQQKMSSNNHDEQSCRAYGNESITDSRTNSQEPAKSWLAYACTDEQAVSDTRDCDDHNENSREVSTAIDEPDDNDQQNAERAGDGAREAARKARQAAYREYKESDAYKQKKLAEKTRRDAERAAYKQSAEYKQRKAEAKRKRREQREAMKKKQQDE